MVTIKSFTDLSQSKTLSKILPLESADMYYFRQIDNDYFPPDVESICPIPLFKDGKEDFNYDIRCWSLAALLGVLPRKVELEDTAYTIGVSLDSINYSNVNNGNLLLEAKVKDNFVDTCYEVIIKLYELKKL